MGTRWSGLLAPIDKPTGDGRRMAADAMRWRPLPLGLKWQRVDSDGHDDSVIIGTTDTMNIGTVDEAIKAGWISAEAAAITTLAGDDRGVWGAGEVFDNIDAATMPRLAEDVAEALHLLGARVIGPSVDAGAAEAMLVETGHDEPLTEERLDELWEESWATGEDPDLEVLFTDYEVAAATLVTIPAFVEARPFELHTEAPAEQTPAPADAALVASLIAAVPSIPTEVFSPPEFSEYTDIRVEDRGEGFLRISGHFAPAGTCHLEFAGLCMTPPTSHVDYVPFHRYPIQTDDGELLAVGRITTGFGRVGTGCACCRGKDDHACGAFGLADTISHYDKLTTLAHVRAGEDQHGLWIVGVIDTGVDNRGLATLRGEKFSGDWREHGGNLELVEVLALTVGQPGFPSPRTHIGGGRQRSLVAAFRRPRRPDKTAALTIDYPRLGREVASSLGAQGFTLNLPNVTTTAGLTAAAEHTGAMVALRMTDDDAASLALDGGEPADELHLTLGFLGEAADIPPETQQAVTDAMTALAGVLPPVVGELFAASIFNPEDDDRETAAVIGVGGDGLADAHSRAMDALTAAFADLPEQHAPFNAHITLAYTNDLTVVEQLAERTGQPVTFDRLRVAFGGNITDIPLTGTPPDEAALLAAAVTAALDAVDADDRARQAARITAELEAVSV